MQSIVYSTNSVIPNHQSVRDQFISFPFPLSLHAPIWTQLFFFFFFTSSIFRLFPSCYFNRSVFCRFYIFISIIVALFLDTVIFTLFTQQNCTSCMFSTLYHHFGYCRQKPIRTYIYPYLCILHADHRQLYMPVDTAMSR